MQWINVYDIIKPNMYEDVLLYVKYRGHEFIISGWWDQSEGWQLYGDYLYSEITHWMPLPPPPEK